MLNKADYPNYEKIKESFKKSVFNYTLIKRSENTVIYKQEHEGRIIAYEVHKIRFAKPFVLAGNELNAREYLASDGEFGRYGWTFKSKNKALFKFAELESNVGKNV